MSGEFSSCFLLCRSFRHSFPFVIYFRYFLISHRDFYLFEFKEIFLTFKIWHAIAIYKSRSHVNFFRKVTLFPLETSTEKLRFYVAGGSYDGSVFALEHEHAVAMKGPSRLKGVFIDPEAHSSPITALSLGGDLIVSGSSDEVIQVKHWHPAYHVPQGFLHLPSL